MWRKKIEVELTKFSTLDRLVDFSNVIPAMYIFNTLVIATLITIFRKKTRY
jgi:hypothetical protein